MMRFLLLLGLFISAPSWGQDFLNLFSPGARATSIELEGIYLPNKPAEAGDETHVIKRGGSLQQRIHQNGNDSIFVGARYTELDLSSSDNLMRDYYNQQINFSYKRILPDDRFWLATLSYGSASDRPFKNARDNTLSANYVQKFGSRWFGVLNFSNNRTFLNNVPLPGVFYIKELKQDRALILGFPIIYWLTSLSDKWSLRYFGLLPWSHRLRVLYRGRHFSPYIGYEESPESYFRHDRDNDRHRVFWFERRVMLGAETSLKKNMRLDWSAGWAFDRQFFEARNYSEEKEQLNNIAAAWFMALSINLSF